MSNIISILEKNLVYAKEQEAKAISKAQKSFGKKEREEYNKAYQKVLTAERDLARELGEPYAEPVDFPVQWNIGAPLPFLLQNDRKTFLTFYIREVDPNWDGTYVNIVDPKSTKKVKLALVEFKCCSSTKLGAPNDEVHEGHPLNGKGLDSYTAQIVKNSSWLKEIQAINSVHSCYNEKSWESLNHYVFWFHDSTFECIAESFSIETYSTNMQELLLIINEKLLE